MLTLLLRLRHPIANFVLLLCFSSISQKNCVIDFSFYSFPRVCLMLYCFLTFHVFKDDDDDVREMICHLNFQNFT
jgi:hypothetical protein